MKDTIVVGGGITGLTAAALLARGGAKVTLYERASQVGGRAASALLGGGVFNLGPHALYRGGRARQILAGLGIHPRGGIPSASGNCALRAGTMHALPGGLVSLVTTSLLSLPQKLAVARILAGAGRIDVAPLMSTTVEDWIRAQSESAAVRDLLRATFRVTCYANASEVMSAGAAIAQLARALAENVLYVDGGWQTIVDALREIAIAAGAAIVRERVTGLSTEDGVVRGVHVGGEIRRATHVVLALPPRAAAEVSSDAVIRAWADDAVPLRAACLDVALRALPRPKAKFVLGIDVPIYVSVHSAVAKLGEAVVVHGAKYLAPGDAGASARAEIENALDHLQPGWHEHVIDSRWTPAIAVVGDLPRASRAGVRPGPEVPHLRGLWVCGDWIGAEGMLTDGALASAELAARSILGAEALREAA
jgi:phytoene dehydrogenase-like protein